jgi:hypothetical protein
MLMGVAVSLKLQTSFVLCHPLHKLEEEERVFFMVSRESIIMMPTDTPSFKQSFITFKLRYNSIGAVGRSQSNTCEYLPDHTRDTP